MAHYTMAAPMQYKNATSADKAETQYRAIRA